MDPLQVLQKRCIRIISHVHPREHTAPFAKDLHILLLYDLYLFKTVCLLFSAMNNACCDVLCNLFKKRSDIHTRLTRHANISFYILPCCSKVRKNFIVNRESKLWNSLESSVRNCKSLNAFKRCVKDMIFANYV